MLRIAYLNKERAAQFEEKILLATREQERIQAIEDQMEHERLRAIRAESAKEKEKRLLLEQQREVLSRQIAERREELSLARAQIDREREAVDAIIDRINSEDVAEYKSRKDKQAATAAMVRSFEQQRQREVEAARAAARAEEERINMYNRAMEARSEGVAAKKQAKKDEDDRILQQIVEETEKKRKEQEEFNSLRDLLWEEELEAKRNEEAESKKFKQTMMKKEMMQANAQMMVSKEAQRQREAEAEARLVSVMRHKFAVDEAKERADEESKRNAKLYHMTLVDRQRNERKSMYEQERAQEAEVVNEAARREEYRKKVIQEARKRLLEEHAQKLAGFMPNKAFATKEEAELFRNAAQNNGGSNY
jgi:hypothetical protein